MRSYIEYNQWCISCGGYGHIQSECPTHAKYSDGLLPGHFANCFDPRVMQWHNSHYNACKEVQRELIDRITRQKTECTRIYNILPWKVR